MTSFRVIALALSMLMIIGMAKGRWLDLETYSTSMISYGVHNISNENPPNLELRISNSSTSYGGNRCESLYRFLPCADTMPEGVLLMFLYTYLMMSGEEWINTGSKVLYVWMGANEKAGESVFRVLMALPKIVVVIGRGVKQKKAQITVNTTVNTNGVSSMLESNGTLNDATPRVDVAKVVSPSVVDDTVEKEKLIPVVTTTESYPPLPTQLVYRIILFQFSSMDGLDAMPENGPWFIHNNLLVLRKWHPDENLLKEYVSTIPVWVKLHGVPVTAFSEDGLCAIATKLGTPLMLNLYTADMCMQSWGMTSYARAMIELRADVELKDNIMAAMPKITREGYNTCNIRVEYEWKPSRCACCKVFGHVVEECPKNIGAGATKNLKKTSQTPKGISVGQKMGFKPKQVFQPVSKKSTADTCGKKNNNSESTKEVSKLNPFEVLTSVGNDVELGTNGGISNSADKGTINVSSSNTYIVEKIDKIERQIHKGKLGFVDDDENPLVPTDGSDKGYDTNSLLEQWRDSYPDNDDYDPYDDDMNENHVMSEHLQSICDDLDITLIYGELDQMVFTDMISGVWVIYKRNAVLIYIKLFVCFLAVPAILSSASDAQNRVVFGVNMYAGSTVITLTLVWGISIIFSKHKDQNGSSPESDHQQDSSIKCLSLVTDTSVKIDKETGKIAVIMLLSLIPFAFVGLVSFVNTPAMTLSALIVSCVSLLVYFGYQVYHPWIGVRSLTYLKQENLRMRFLDYVKMLAEHVDLVDKDGKPDFTSLKSIFNTVDKNEDESITPDELETLVEKVFQLKEDKISKEYAKTEILILFDINKNGEISWDEFKQGCTNLLEKLNNEANSSGSAYESICDQASNAYSIRQTIKKRQDSKLSIIEIIMPSILKQLEKNELVKKDGQPNKEKIEGLFSDIDKDNDNVIQQKELKQFIETLDFGIELDRDRVLQALVKDFDEDKNYVVEKKEFIEGFIKWIEEAINHDQSIKDITKAIEKIQKENWGEIDTLEKWEKPKAIVYLIFGAAIMITITSAFITSVKQFSNAAHIPFLFTSFVMAPIALKAKMVIKALLKPHDRANASLTFSEVCSLSQMHHLLLLYS
ncbi:EF-hand domain pair containing protein [Tanacetum coccineum]